MLPIFHFQFSRNFGKEAAMYVEFCNAKGVYIAVLDADIHNPASSNPVTFLYGVITDFTESKFYDAKNSIVVVHNSSSFAL